MQRSVLTTILLVAAMLLAGYLGAIAYLYAFQRDYVFKPDGTLDPPAALGLEGVDVIAFRAADGTNLAGWYAQARLPGQPTLLYLHGNAGNLSDRADRFEQVLASGFGLMTVSYRGYAGSQGSPSETALFSDALEIYDWLAERADSIVVHGESLGAAVAVYIAAERPADALILEAPFTAALDVAAATYPWVPVTLLMRDPFLSREHIVRVAAPVLILHGTDDRVIPVAQGRELFEAAGEPKEFATFEGGGHSDLWERGLWPIVVDFLMRSGVAAQPIPDAAVRRMPSAAG